MTNWQKQLKDEFGIHFKDSPDELQFLEAFIEDLLDEQKKEIKGKIYDFVESESGKSGRKEILEFIKKL